jgi:type III restriction enzyme
VQRKRTAAVAWCDRINTLKPEERSERPWNYVLLSEDAFYRWRDGGGSVKEMLEFARLRSQGEKGQQRLL